MKNNEKEIDEIELKEIRRRKLEARKMNDLTGKEWLQNSFSIWRDMSKTKEEKDFGHPASYPVELCEKLIRTFSKNGQSVIDPFNGIGSTLVACKNLGWQGTGIDLSEEYCEIAMERVDKHKDITVINGDSFKETKKINSETFDLCLTSPPYWDILNMKRSADNRETMNYSDMDNDVGNMNNYNEFLDSLEEIFTDIYRILKHDSYCLVNVMDIRKKSEFYPLHSDLAERMKKIGFIYDDIIIWDRQNDYNNMRPLGYPYRFRINKVHEYILIFLKK